MSDLPERDAETYIGDGVYISFDGYQVWLRTTRSDGAERIALEPQVYQAMLAWIAQYKTLQTHMLQS